MPPDERSLTSERMDIIVGNLLRTGVILSAAIIFAGGILYLLRHGGEMPSYHVFRGEPADLRSVPGVLQSIAGLHARGIIQLGLLLLIATPVARVAFLVYGFARLKDLLYAAVALVVLALLVYGLTGAQM